MYVEPTARSDPEVYLCLRKFSRRLPKCPRTGHPVSYADMGDPDGVPLLWIMPSGCSRWLVAPQDPLAKRYGVRLIAVDRPGVGATPSVPLSDRIRLSCDMMVSVLEHLEIKLAHILATSAGIYYAYHLLIHHPSIFQTSLNPPPTLYLIAPWSPLLPPDHPDYYSSPFAWIPDKLIETQHLTMPHLMKLGQGASDLWTTSTKVLNTGLGMAKSFLWNTDAPPMSTGLDPHAEETEEEEQKEGADVHVNVEGIVPVNSVEEESLPKNKLWGPLPCCVGCLTTEYFHEENSQGVGQEHLQCLNRGSTDTGHEWMQRTVASLATGLRHAQCPIGKNRQEHEEGVEDRTIPYPLNVQLWWGWEDGMVPRKGQLWFNKTISGHPNEIRVEMHDVPDGDHTDLLGRIEGIHQVYGMIWEKGQELKNLDER